MAMVEAVLRLLQQGWPYRRIARELGIHRETVARLAGKSKPAKAPLGSSADANKSKPAKAPLGSEGSGPDDLEAATPPEAGLDVVTCSSASRQPLPSKGKSEKGLAGGD